MFNVFFLRDKKCCHAHIEDIFKPAPIFEFQIRAFFEPFFDSEKDAEEFVNKIFILFVPPNLTLARKKNFSSIEYRDRRSVQLYNNRLDFWIFLLQLSCKFHSTNLNLLHICSLGRLYALFTYPLSNKFF